MSTPTELVSGWLSTFGAALSRNDIVAAVEMFGDDCYWRDLVTFTWNIKTVEGRDEIRDMLDATLEATWPQLADRWRGRSDATWPAGSP